MLQELHRQAKARGIDDIEFLACQPGFVASPLYNKSVGGTVCDSAYARCCIAVSVVLLLPLSQACACQSVVPAQGLSGP